MNSNFPQNEREQLEAKLTALLLGELPADEAIKLAKAMERDPKLAALYERLKVTIGLVRESAAQPATETTAQTKPLKLSTDRREKLLAQFKTVAPKEFSQPRRTSDWLLPAAAAAAIIIAGAIGLPNFVKTRTTSPKNVVINNLRLLDGAKQQWALENNKSGDAVPTMEDLLPYLGRSGTVQTFPSVAGETYVPGKVSELPRIETTKSQAKKLIGRKEVTVTPTGDGKVQFSLLSPPPGQIGAIVYGVSEPSTDSSVIVARNARSRNQDRGQFEFGLNSTTPPFSAAPPTRKTEIILPTSGKSVPVGDPEWIGALAGTAGNSENKLPILGDLPAAGRLFRSESNLADSNGRTYGGLATDDAGAGLRYIAPDGVAYSVTNAVAGFDLRDAPGNNGQSETTPIAAPMLAESAKEPTQKTEIVLPAQQSALENRPTIVANVGPMPTGGFGGGGGGGFGGKQVEIASAANSTSTNQPRSLRYVTGLDPTAEIQLAVKNYLRTNGVDMDSAGKSVFFNDRQGTLTVRGTDEDLNKVQAALDALNAAKANGNTNPTWTINTFNRVGPTDPTLTDDQLRHNIGTNNYPVFTLNEVEVTTLSGRQANFEPTTGVPTTVDTSNQIRAYAAANEELESQKHWRQILQMKTGQEEVDKNLPKARMVSIPDPATAEPEQKEGFFGKLRETLSGKVERSARITVEQEHPDIGSLGIGSAGNGYDPYFVQTEQETIKSYAVLKRVVEDLKLDGGDKSKTQAAVQQLKKNIDVSPVKNTKYLEISAKDAKPEEAARLANAVAQAYKDYRAEEYEELKNHGLQSLEQQLAEQDKKVEVAQAKVDELAKSMGQVAGKIEERKTDTALPKPTVPPLTPQPEILTRENAFSTFSLNVSDVSFKLAAASLEKGQMPEPASIRSEEFINAFNYRDPDAGPGAPIAFASERARYPFAHNRELLRFSLKTAAAGRQAGRPLNIVLLLDNSGSMERADRVSIIQEALRVLAGQLHAADTFSIVTFARTATLRVDGVHGDQAAAAAAEIAKLTPEGGTNLGDALDLAYETALHHYLANGDNRVVLLTDGAANLGDVNPDDLKKKVEAHRKQGVALDCFGIGWEDYNDDLLEVLTRNGDGRYGFMNTPEAASTEFVSQIAGALHVAAADVKVQVEFNPKRVTSYRQIGYAKHQLTKEQFRDNTVDAAEIAAQEAGNALYTIETNPQGEGSIATVRVRYKVPATGEYREQAWDVPYTGSAVALDQASPAMRLATTASAFSEWLATSPFAAEVSTDQLLRYLNGVPKIYGADTRPAKLEWMIRQARSISGK